MRKTATPRSVPTAIARTRGRTTCACGATLLSIKNRYRNAQLYGIELNSNAATDANLVADISSTNIEQSTLDYPSGFFDYIIFADVLEHLADPWKVLADIRTCLSPSGQVLASIPNVMHYTVIRDLINGFWSTCPAGATKTYKQLRISKDLAYESEDKSLLSSR